MDKLYLIITGYLFFFQICVIFFKLLVNGIHIFWSGEWKPRMWYEYTLFENIMNWKYIELTIKTTLNCTLLTFRIYSFEKNKQNVTIPKNSWRIKLLHPMKEKEKKTTCTRDTEVTGKSIQFYGTHCTLKGEMWIIYGFNMTQNPRYTGKAGKVHPTHTQTSVYTHWAISDKLCKSDYYK